MWQIFLKIFSFALTVYYVTDGGPNGVQRAGLWPPAGRDGRLEPEHGSRPWGLALAGGTQQEREPYILPLNWLFKPILPLNLPFKPILPLIKLDLSAYLS